MTDRDDLTLKRALDGLTRTIEPPEDLWPGIRSRLPRRHGYRWMRDAGLLRVAAGLGIVAILAGVLASQRGRASAWHIAGGAGTPTLDGHALAGRTRLGAGGEVRTDRSSRAVAEVGTIGRVTMGPGTAVRLVEARATRHRLALQHGTIEARIDAPPRLFIVETPSGTAVDMGCAYTLSVDSAGNGRLTVTAGWVEYGDRHRQALVPAGFVATTVTGRGIGLPVRDSAEAGFAAAATAFDSAPGVGTLQAVLAEATRRDAVTLWHLITRTDGIPREQVVARLATLVPLPAGVTREAVLRLDDAALRLWWVALPGTLPIIPSWTQSLWRWWLRLVG